MLSLRASPGRGRLSLLALLCAASLVGAELRGAHACPHHDPGRHPAPHAGTAEEGTPERHATHDQPERDVAANERANEPSPEEDGETRCTCIGTCHGSAVSPLPGADAQSKFGVESTPATIHPPAEGTTLPHHLLPHFQPFGTGPPASP